MLLRNDKQQLAHWHWEIARFLEQCLALKLRSDAMIAPISQGVNFLGYITRPHYRLVRHRVVNNLNQKLAAFESGYIRGQGSSTHGQSLQALRSCMASYLGYFHHASSQRLIASLWQKWPWLGGAITGLSTGPITLPVVAHPCYGLFQPGALFSQTLPSCAGSNTERL